MLTAILSALLLNSAGVSEVATTQTTGIPPVEAYGRMPFLTNVRISPSGNRFFALVRPAGASNYTFAVFEKSDPLRVIFSAPQSEDIQFRRPFWKRDDRIVFSTRTLGRRDDTETVETRLYSLNPDTGKAIPLYKLDPGDVPQQIQDDIVSRLPNDPEHILVEYWKDGLNSVYEVDVDRTRFHNRIVRGRQGIGSWYADGTGTVRAGAGVLYDKKRKMTVLTPDDKWKDISHRVEEGSPVFAFVGFPHTRDKAFIVSNHETETDALYLYDIPTDTIEKQLFHSEVSDVFGLINRSSDGAALGVVFVEDEAETHWFGDNFISGMIDSIRTVLPTKTITVSSLNINEKHAVIYSDSQNDPGQYYLYNRELFDLLALPPQYPELQTVSMGKTFRKNYTARDGLTIPAYLTLPPGYEGLDAVKSLPFIVLPHGGPNARTFKGFDWEVQFLVSRGYGVLEMNFRGSSGYGQEFEEAGDGEWGQAMQDDISDGAKWLVEQGYADVDRLAIMGHSYGGYAALMGAAKTPDLYQCAVTHGAVTHLPSLLRNSYKYVGGRYSTRFIGRLGHDGATLRENSPALRADDIAVPVLLFHGEEDRVVNVEQTERMAKALKKSKKQFKYIELPKGSHYLNVADNRLTFLKETEAFLSDCLN